MEVLWLVLSKIWWAGEIPSESIAAVFAVFLSSELVFLIQRNPAIRKIRL